MKCLHDGLLFAVGNVVPLAGAWIEMIPTGGRRGTTAVVPLAGGVD